jgi:hypothetical protein
LYGQQIRILYYSKTMYKCIAYISLVQVPRTVDVPEKLRNLTPATLAALSLLEVNMGPTVYAKDRLGRRAGYRQHTSMIRFSWQATSVPQRLERLGTPGERNAGRSAYRWLLESKDSSYHEFHEEHRHFLHAKPDADDRQRKRWLRIIERVGVECAIWPHLFWKTALCLTYVRELNPWRLMRHAGGTWENVLDGNAEDYEEYAEEADKSMSSIKRWYQALVMSPVLDYACSSELLQFAWDLTLWSAIGAKKNVSTGCRLNASLPYSCTNL